MEQTRHGLHWWRSSVYFVRILATILWSKLMQTGGVTHRWLREWCYSIIIIILTTLIAHKSRHRSMLDDKVDYASGWKVLNSFATHPKFGITTARDKRACQAASASSTLRTNNSRYCEPSPLQYRGVRARRACSYYGKPNATSCYLRIKLTAMTQDIHRYRLRSLELYLLPRRPELPGILGS